MIFRTSLGRKILPMMSLLALFPGVLPAQDAEEILRSARQNALGTPVILEAQLRSGRETVPFEIVVDDKISYNFSNPEQSLILDLQDSDSKLQERMGGKTATIREARFDEGIRGTDISYEDLALKFLYWKNPKILDEETLRTRKTWKMEVQAPRAQSQYGVARLWIDQSNGALMRVEGYNDQGKLIRRFEVISAQKLDGLWMLKQMRIESVDPETRKTTSRTYLEVTGRKG